MTDIFFLSFNLILSRRQVADTGPILPLYSQICSRKKRKKKKNDEQKKRSGIENWPTRTKSALVMTVTKKMKKQKS
jgi:hypothetical protein